MSFGQAFALMRRHLVAVVVIFVFTLGMAWDIEKTPPPYTESANVIFTPPAVNPYSSLSSSALVTAAQVMTKTMASPESQREVRKAGGTADFTIGLVNFTTSSFRIILIRMSP